MIVLCIIIMILLNPSTYIYLRVTVLHHTNEKELKTLPKQKEKGQKCIAQNSRGYQQFQKWSSKCTHI